MRSPYQRMVPGLSVSERRQLDTIEKECSRRFRDFWIVAMKRRGWTNVKIAKEIELSEGTVRAILKKAE